MLDLAKCQPLSDELAIQIVAQGSLIYGTTQYIWSEAAAEMHNGLWLAEHAPDFTSIPNVRSAALCPGCRGVCVIVGVVHEAGQPRQIIHRCSRCLNGWGVPETVYTEGYSND